MKLVDDIEATSKRWSVQIMKLGTAATAAWLAVTAAGLASSVPAWVPQAVAGLVFLGGVIAAYLPQSNLPQAPKDAP